MRKLFLFMVMLIQLSAAGIAWQPFYDEALKQAQAEHKKVLVFMSQPGCGTCEYMKENVFSDGEVKAYITAHFIPLQLNVHHDDVPEHLRERVTPVFHFLDASGKDIHPKLIGGKTAPFFLKLLNEVNGK